MAKTWGVYLVDLSSEETAGRIGVSVGTIGALIRSGELAAYSASRSPLSKKPRWRITPEALAAFIAKRTANSSAAGPAPIVTHRRQKYRAEFRAGNYVRFYEE